MHGLDSDWIEFPENDDYLPFEERAWVKRLRERAAARERFDRLFPNFFERVGQAIAEDMTRMAIDALMESD